MQARSFLGLRALAVLFLSLLAVSAAAQRADNMDRSPAELLVERPVAPGQEVEVALRFQPLDGWHGYWANPGDAGEGMRLEWNLPAGWQAGEPQYPVPEKLVIAGLMNHVYEGEHAVLVTVQVPAEAAPGRSYPVSVYGEWLSCSDTLCVPQWGTLSAQVTVGEAVVIDVSKHLTNVLELSLEERWVRVQCGVVKDQLNAALRPYGSVGFEALPGPRLPFSTFSKAITSLV